MVCRPRKKQAPHRYYTRNMLILPGTVDDCENLYICIKVWGRQVFGLTGIGFLLVKASRS